MDSFTPLVETRKATAQELPRVIELTKEMYDEIELNLSTSGWEESAISWLEDAQDRGHARVAVTYDQATEQIVASGVGIIYEDIPQPWLPNGKMGYIRWMSTTEDFRGFGLGEQVLHHLMSWFKENQIVRVQLHASDKAIEFYRQHGFENTNYDNMWWRKETE